MTARLRDDLVRLTALPSGNAIAIDTDADRIAGRYMLRPADATERGAASPVALLFDNYREHVRLVAWIAGFAHGTDSAAVLRSSTEGLACGLLSIRPMKNQPIDDTAQPALQRDPDEWKTGDEPMTDAQKSYLQTLCRETGQEFDDSLSKADASKLIDELRERSPRLASE